MIKNQERLHEVKAATNAFLSRMWEENYKRNLPYIPKTPGVAGLKNRFAGLPAIVVGAGPSLDRNIRFLPLAVGKAVIISCDTALKILLRHGVVPDIVANLDPQLSIVNFLDGVDTRNIALVAPTITNPALRENWKGHFFFYNKFAPDIPLLTQIAQTHREIGTLTPGGTVLSVAFDLAFKSGADPIAFIGQDLGYTAQKAYAEGTHYGDYKAQNIFDVQGDNIVEETDLFGRKCKTQKSMAVTKEWFGWACKTWDPEKKRKIFNCSEAGILTEYPLTPFSEFVSRFCNRKSNIKWTIKKAIKVKR